MTEHNMVGQSTAVNQNDKPRDLDKLASIIRLGFEEIQVQLRNALRIGLVMGEALNEAKRQVGNGGWGKWLRDNCKFSVRSAQLFQRLDNFRDVVEAELENNPELSLRAAQKLIAFPQNKTEDDAGSDGAGGSDNTDNLLQNNNTDTLPLENDNTDTLPIENTTGSENTRDTAPPVAAQPVKELVKADPTRPLFSEVLESYSAEEVRDGFEQRGRAWLGSVMSPNMRKDIAKALPVEQLLDALELKGSSAHTMMTKATAAKVKGAIKVLRRALARAQPKNMKDTTHSVAAPAAGSGVPAA